MEKVLIIEPEATSREALKSALQFNGYEVRTAADGDAGLVAFRELQPELVLTGIHLPGIGGLELLRRFKQINPEVEVLLITGREEAELAIEAFQWDASDLILKPVTEQALDLALRRARAHLEMRRKVKEHEAHLEGMLREATAEIRKRHDFQHQLIQTSMDGIIANDPKGNIIIFNEGAARICGYSSEEAIGCLNVSQLYPPGRARKVKRKMHGPEYGGPGRLINYETKVVAKDGHLVPILLSATTIFEEQREAATVGFFKDLTEVRHLQQELLKKTQMAAIGQAMAEIAHNVKNILYGMNLGAFRVQKALAKGDLEAVKRGWQTVHKSIERISRFSLDMLSYARGRSQSRQQICLNELVEDACDSLSGQAEARGVTVDQQPMIGLPPVWGDLEGLHTCILNLIGNALEAFPENNAGGLVTVQTGVRSDDHIFVQVTDTGKGIGPDLIEHIGKPLFSTKGARGTGLGLAITTKIIHDHGGRIEIQSELHRGSTFTLILPAADSKRTPPDST